MMQVPKEPIRSKFDPEKVTDPVLRQVFRNSIAWQLWMMIKATHLTDASFNGWCLKTAEKIAEKKSSIGSISAIELYEIIRPRLPYRPDNPRFLSDRFEESEAFLERLAEAINGGRQISYEIVA